MTTKCCEYGVQVVVDYSLADHVYAKGRIQNVEMVGLWLGANVMLEYSVEEATELLVRGGRAR